MAGWAAGVFTRARNWVTDKNGAVNPQAALFDQEDDNFASGLNNCVTKDGLNKPSATMDWNAQILKNVGNSMFNAQRITSNQVLAASAATAVIYNSTNNNVGGAYDISTGIFTAPLAGTYIFSARADLLGATGSGILTGIYFSKNNVDAGGASRFDLPIFGPYAGGGVTLAASSGYSFGGSIALILAATDTVRVKIGMGTVVSGNVNVQTLGSYFSGYMLG